MKECGSCGVIKSPTEFSSNGAAGLKSFCRPCVNNDVRMRCRTKHGLSELPFQPTAEAYRVFMAWDRRMAA